MEYSPFSLDVEHPDTDFLRTCRELGVALVAYSPLGRGFLAGKFQSPDDLEEGDFRKTSPRFSKENFGKNLVLVDKIKALADKKGCTAGQLVLAWLLRQGDEVILIPGTTRIEALEENVNATKVQLTDAEANEIRKTAEEADVVGDRYPNMTGMFADTPEKT